MKYKVACNPGGTYWDIVVVDSKSLLPEKIFVRPRGEVEPTPKEERFKENPVKLSEDDAVAPVNTSLKS